MTSGPIILWQIDRETMETVTDFLFLGSKITAHQPLGLVHWDDPEGWNGEGGGRRVQDGEHMYIYADFKF